MLTYLYKLNHDTQLDRGIYEDHLTDLEFLSACFSNRDVLIEDVSVAEAAGVMHTSIRFASK